MATTRQAIDAFTRDLDPETALLRNGAKVHWATDGEEANQLILDIMTARDAKKMVKSKSMASEETDDRFDRDQVDSYGFGITLASGAMAETGTLTSKLAIRFSPLLL